MTLKQSAEEYIFKKLSSNMITKIIKILNPHTRIQC